MKRKKYDWISVKQFVFRKWNTQRVSNIKIDAKMKKMDRIERERKNSSNCDDTDWRMYVTPVKQIKTKTCTASRTRHCSDCSDSIIILVHNFFFVRFILQHFDRPFLLFYFSSLMARWSAWMNALCEWVCFSADMNYNASEFRLFVTLTIVTFPFSFPFHSSHLRRAGE